MVQGFLAAAQSSMPVFGKLLCLLSSVVIAMAYHVRLCRLTQTSVSSDIILAYMGIPVISLQVNRATSLTLSYFHLANAGPCFSV